MNIKKEVSHRHFYREYNRLCKADSYIIAFPEADNIYYICMKKIPFRWTRLGHASSSHKHAQKMDLYIPLKELRKADNKIFLCPITRFEEAQRQYKNKGLALEAIIHEQEHLPYKPDSTPFYVAGDIMINGIDYQIKWYDRATFTTITVLHHAQEYEHRLKKILEGMEND